MWGYKGDVNGPSFDQRLLDAMRKKRSAIAAAGLDLQPLRFLQTRPEGGPRLFRLFYHVLLKSNHTEQHAG